MVSCDYDRVGHFSNGCVDSRLLELVSRASKQEPEQAVSGNGDMRWTRFLDQQLVMEHHERSAEEYIPA